MSQVDRYGEFFWLIKIVIQMLTVAFNEGFDAKEITLAQYLVLLTLQSESQLTSAEVARRCFISAQAANVTITRLETMNLIRRRPAAAGGRSLEATLTKRGESIVADCKRLTRGIGSHIFAGIPVADIETANRVLGVLANALDRPEKVRPLRAWNQPDSATGPSGSDSLPKAKTSGRRQGNRN